VSARRSSLALPLAAVLVAAFFGACGGANPSAGSSGSSTSSDLTTSFSTATGSATPTGRLESTAPAAGASGGSSASPSPSISSTCTPDPPTALSSGWTTLQAHGGDYSFAYPPAWQSLYGAFVFDTNTLVAPATFAETGLPSDATTLADLVRAPGLPMPGAPTPSPDQSPAPDAGLPNAEVLIVPGVVSSTDTVYARELARFTSVADIQVVATNLVGCIGGQRALGVQFVFSAGTTFQQSWYIVHNGRLYDFQWLAAKAAPQTGLFAEMVRTFQWTPGVPPATPLPSVSGSAAPSAAAASAPNGAVASGAPDVSPGAGASGAGSGAFVLAGMAAGVVSGAPQANPSTFTTTLAKSLKAIYAVFVLQRGLTGTVRGELKEGAFTLATVMLDYGAGNTWGDFTINSSNGFMPGSDYLMILTHGPSGASIRLPFTVK